MYLLLEISQFFLALLPYFCFLPDLVGIKVNHFFKLEKLIDFWSTDGRFVEGNM